MSVEGGAGLEGGPGINHNHWKSAVKDTVAGGIGSIFCVYVGLPFDVVRYNLPYGAPSHLHVGMSVPLVSPFQTFL